MLPDMCFSEEEQQHFLIKLRKLLEFQVEKYNGADSTSITVEKVQALLVSLLYRLQLAAEQFVPPKSKLLNGNLYWLWSSDQAVKFYFNAVRNLTSEPVQL